jgi:dUTP pyrophosphatase
MENLEVKIKKLHSDAKIPEYAHEGDAGMDLVATSKEEKKNFTEYGIGLAFELPQGYVGLVFPRSSLTNKGLVMGNHVGVLDSGYRGELKVRFKRFEGDDYEIGDRVGQLMIVPYPKVIFKEVDILSPSERGDGSFGSTGR